MILYRPVGLKELELIYDSGMRAFPARLPQQPIFYPVLDLDYARQTASDWNVKNGQLAGYVTQFKVDDAAVSKFEKHTVGGSQHQELWIPAEELEGFNQHILGHIKVVEAHFGKAFQGFVPEAFGLGGKNAVEQFTLLANSYVYKRMEFYLEIKRNHKAVFLNYPFWQKYDFKNPGLKGKVIQAIKEGWLTSFPKIPLVTPALEEVRPVKQIDPPSFVEHVHEEPSPVKKINLPSWVKSLEEDIKPAKQTGSRSLGRALPKPTTPVQKSNLPSLTDPLDEEDESVKQADSQPSVDSFDEDSTLVSQTDSRSLVADPDEEEPVRQTDSQSLGHRVREDSPLVKPIDLHPLVNPVHEAPAPVQQTVSHFSQGVTLGLSGKIHEAIAELSRAAQEDPEHILAHTSLGVAFHRLGEDERAWSCYEAALQIDPNDAEAHYFRANILYSQGNVRDAIAGYTIAIGLEPELIQAHQTPSPSDRLTDYSPAPAEMYRIARPAHRILDLTRLLDSNPGQANLLKERAAEYYRLWNYEQTIADYNSFLALEPDDADALHLRGVAYEQLRQFDRALQDYQRASALDPQLADLYIERGITYGKTGNFRQSVASLNEAVRLAPRNPDGYFNRGTSHFQLGDFERAIDDFAMVMQLAPKDEAAYYWRGVSNEAAGRRREAIADYRQFLAISQDQNVRAEIEQKLSQWGALADRNSLSNRGVVPDDRQKTNQRPFQESDQPLDLHGLLLALGERAVHSTWFGSAVECFGERAEELYSFTEHNQPIQGRDLLRIASGIRQTVAGDFTAFDADATSHWLFIHAWEGRGFYIETNDPKSKERLKTNFPAAEQVDGASPPYESIFIRI